MNMLVKMSSFDSKLSSMPQVKLRPCLHSPQFLECSLLSSKVAAYQHLDDKSLTLTLALVTDGR